MKPPPKKITIQTIAANVLAVKAVRNQPLITVKTPEIRYTAVSRSQAPSANDDPIATIKVT